MDEFDTKVIIVEGKTDKKRIDDMILENVQILCTNGTLGTEKLDHWAELYYDRDLYILVDADKSGEKLRHQLNREFPGAQNLYIDKVYKEVAASPYQHLASVLLGANIKVNPEYLTL